MNVRNFPWAIVLILTGAAVVTAPLVVPYFLGLQQDAPNDPTPGDFSPRQIVGLMMLQVAVVTLVASAAGLWLASKIGLGMPYLETWIYGKPLGWKESPAPFTSIVWPAAFWAIVTALVAFAIDAAFYYGLGETLPAPEIHARIDVAPWRGLLASFFAPIAEEVLHRLFLLSLLAWIMIKLFRLQIRGRGWLTAMWVANFLTALFFGWVHTSNEELYTSEVTITITIRTLLIILGPGLAFGYLYFKRGLEAAMLSHFVIDVIVHFIRPIVESW